MSMAEVELLLASALKGGSEERLELLRFIRISKMREPRIVLEFAPKVSERYSVCCCYPICDLKCIKSSSGG